MKTVKILWIDDAESWALSVQNNLIIIGNKYGINFVFVNATNGENIVFQCSNYDFDLVIMDYDMEPFSGDKYIQDVRNEDHLEHIPIFFYSQNNSVVLENFVVGIKNIACFYRPNLEDFIREKYCN